MNKPFYCEGCKRKLDHVLLDGYPIGDRLLEGVMFVIRKDRGKFTAATQDKDKSYMQTLNEKKWLKAMAKYASETDVATCPSCHGDVDLNPATAVHGIAGNSGGGGDTGGSCGPR